ncbi:MAG: hypothetical protein LBP56_00395 [Odoribacteraceae bacterium]|nr:hypothetical protein [Odoribacteraceae bacterium]
MKTMKSLLLLFIAGILLPLPARAQDNSPIFEYFTLKSCGNDTLLYLKKNHGTWGDRYMGKPLSLLLDDARDDFPFKAYWTNMLDNGTIEKFVFFFEPVDKVKAKIKKNLPLHTVHVALFELPNPRDPVQRRLDVYKALEKRGFSRILACDESFYRIAKDMIVEYTYWKYIDEMSYEHVVE